MTPSSARTPARSSGRSRTRSLIERRCAARPQLGSLGAGNHFLEVQVVDEIRRPEAAEAMGLRLGQVCVMIHSGSRGIGHQTCTDYVRMLDRLMPELGIELPDRQLACVPMDHPRADRIHRGDERGRELRARQPPRARRCCQGILRRSVRAQLARSRDAPRLRHLAQPRQVGGLRDRRARTGPCASIAKERRERSGPAIPSCQTGTRGSDSR